MGEFEHDLEARIRDLETWRASIEAELRMGSQHVERQFTQLREEIHEAREEARENFKAIRDGLQSKEERQRESRNRLIGYIAPSVVAIILGAMVTFFVGGDVAP